MKRSAFAFFVSALGFASLVCAFVVAAVWTSYSPVAYASASSDEQQLIKLENEWNTLAEKKDAAAVSKLMADDYTFVGTEGQIGDKALLLKNMRQGEPGEPRYLSSRVDQIHIHLIFGKVAIVRGRWVGQRTKQNPSAIAEERWTDVWVKGADGWKCETSQSTVIPVK